MASTLYRTTVWAAQLNTIRRVVIWLDPRSRERDLLYARGKNQQGEGVSRQMQVRAHGLMGGMSVVEGIPKRLAVKLPLVLS